MHGGFAFSIQEVTINRLWIQFFQMWGKVGVNIFVLISGYFLIKAKNVKISKVLKLWLQVLFYSITMFLLFTLFGVNTFSVKGFIRSILPIGSSVWWFASTYFVLYLLSPYINIFLNKLDKHTYQKLLILLTILWCVLPTFMKSVFQSNELLWFTYLYAVSGYIRLWIKLDNINMKKCILFFIVVAITTFLSAFILDMIGLKFLFFGKHAVYFFNMQRIFVFVMSLSLFLFFMKLDIGNKKIINYISATTFGVYLIHDNGCIRDFLWNSVFRNADYAASSYLIPYSIGVILIVFLVCMIIEFVRIHMVEKNYMPIINKIAIWIEKQTDKFFDLKIFKDY